MGCESAVHAASPAQELHLSFLPNGEAHHIALVLIIGQSLRRPKTEVRGAFRIHSSLSFNLLMQDTVDNNLACVM